MNARRWAMRDRLVGRLQDNLSATRARPVLARWSRDAVGVAGQLLRQVLEVDGALAGEVGGGEHVNRHRRCGHRPRLPPGADNHCFRGEPVMPLGSVANDRLRHRRIGYARVSKADGSQSLDLPRDALQAAGVDAGYVYHDVASGVHDRPGLDRCVRALRTGDVLVVWKLDRLGRTLAHLS